MQRSSMSAPDSILVIAHAWYGDVIGGAFRLASEFAEDLAAAGYDVHYVCCAPAVRAEYPERERIRGVTVHRYPPPRTSAGPLRRLFYHMDQTGNVVRGISNSRRVVAVSGHSPLQFLGALGQVRSDAFLNYTVHSPFDDEMQAHAPSTSVLRAAVRWPAVWSARRVDHENCAKADRVQCDSQYTLDALRGKHGRQIGTKGCVAPGWVDYAKFSAAGDRGAARRALGPAWSADAPVFFTLRRLEARMGLDTLIDAAALVRDRGRAFRVLIGGSGAQREQLQRQVHERRLDGTVEFLGRIPEADLAACYAAADCFVLPTRALECFGLIVLEAFAAGTPVIASRAAAIPEIASRQGPGWDFMPGDAVGLADRMEALLVGRLRPSTDLRAIAREYDRPRVFEQWRELLVGAGDTRRIAPTVEPALIADQLLPGR